MTSLTRRFIASMATIIIAGLLVFQAAAAPKNSSTPPMVIKAGLLFDGTHFLTGQAVFVQNGIIVQVGPANEVKPQGALSVNVPGGTILPGFIDMHTHHIVNAVPPRRMLEHGVTTARDLV